MAVMALARLDLVIITGFFGGFIVRMWDTSNMQVKVPSLT